ncbi:MAG: DUF3617 family protein [Pseudomonadota bacterium]
MRYTLLLLAAVSSPCIAVDMQPGLWEVNVDNRSVVFPDLPLEPVKVQRCVSAEDARDPTKVLGDAVNQDASNCVYTEKTFSGNMFHFKARCTGTVALDVGGEITYTATSFSGALMSDVDMGDQKMQFQNNVTGRRLGGCS